MQPNIAMKFLLFDATVDGSIKCESINIVEESKTPEYKLTSIIQNGPELKNLIPLLKKRQILKKFGQ